MKTIIGQMVFGFGKVFQTVAWDHEYFRDQKNTDLYKAMQINWES